jgi:hypothetical protein
VAVHSHVCHCAIGARLLFVEGLGTTWSDMRFVPGAGSDTLMYLGAIFEFLLIVANVGTAVVLHPLLKRQSERVALSTSLCVPALLRRRSGCGRRSR